MFKDIKQKGYYCEDKVLDDVAEFQKLKDIMANSVWPKAVDEDEMCVEEEDKIDRAEHIVNDLVDIKDLTGYKVLDFGCGEWQVCNKFKKMGAKLVVGHDLKLKNMPEIEVVKFTDAVNTVKNNGLYNLIFAYDVLNHVKNPKEVIEFFKSIKTPKANIYIRLHPWTSKHATHLYKKKNLAYLHLIFSEEDLIKLGLKGEFTNNYSIEYYDELLKNNFNIIKRIEKKQKVDDFFKINPLLVRRILNNLGLKNGDKFPDLSVQFIDYIVN
jgi:2-polyprenyl-3-methyl-5-hydroxy-6-metoxy-1,4-benzoquinol methylase